jgi:hypothetical protein
VLVPKRIAGRKIISTMQAERLHLAGFERMKYFAPVAICGYLAALCVALIITSAFLDNIRDALAITAAGVFGLLISGGLGAAILRVQLKELRYVVVPTHAGADENFAAVLRMAESSGWNVTVKVPGRCVEARTRGSILSEGEYVVVRFRQTDVLIACITDPSVGFSLVGRRRCVQHRERIRQAVT